MTQPAPPNRYTMIQRAQDVLRDPEQKAVHPDLADAMVNLLEFSPASTALDRVATLIVHVHHEATYNPTE